jgi:hypothetical protein
MMMLFLRRRVRVWLLLYLCFVIYIVCLSCFFLFKDFWALSLSCCQNRKKVSSRGYYYYNTGLFYAYIYHAEVRHLHYYAQETHIHILLFFGMMTWTHARDVC